MGRQQQQQQLRGEACRGVVTRRRPPEPECTLRGHRASVQAVRFLNAPRDHLDENGVLASGDLDGVVKLWDLVLQRPTLSFSAADDSILAIHDHASGAELLTQARDGRIKLWDLERLATGADPGDALARELWTDAFHFTRCAVATRYAPPEKRRRRREPSRGRVDDVDDDGDGAVPRAEARSSVAEAARENATGGLVDNREAPSPRRPQQRPRPTGGIGAALRPEHDDAEPPLDDAPDTTTPEERPNPALDAPRDRLVLAPSDEPEIMALWDSRRTERPVQRLDAGDASRKNLGMVVSAKLWVPPHGTPDVPVAILGHESGDVVAWDLRFLRPRVRAARKLFQGPLLGLDVARDGTRLYGAAVEPTARVADLRLSDDDDDDADASSARIEPRGPPLPATCDAVEHAKEGVGDLVLRPDGKVFATAGWDYRVRLFSARPPDFAPLAVLRHHDQSVNALDFSPDSVLLAAASKDTKLSIWRLFPPSAPAARGA